MSYIYLASPYTGDEENRYKAALAYLAKKTKEGQILFSPIVHSHPMSVEHDMSGAFDFWEEIDYTFIDACDHVRVLCLPGWEKSKGVMKELIYAQEIGKGVEYVDPT